MIGPRLRESLREVDTVARFGGDQFAVLLGNLTIPSHATLVAESLVSALQQPFEINGVPVDVGCALGNRASPPTRQ